MDDALPRAMVLKAHTPEPGPSDQLEAGDPVRVGEESAAYPGWIRITAPNGSKTWAPIGYVRGEPGRPGRLLVDYEPEPLPVHLVLRSSRHMAPRLRAFVDFAVAEFAGVAVIR